MKIEEHSTARPEPAVGAMLTVKETCGRLRVSHNAVYREIREGRLKAIKLGRSTRILEADLSAWIAALPQKQAPTTKGKAAS